MNTLILEPLEVNSLASEDGVLADDSWAMSDEQLADLLADHEADAAWERACDLGHGSW